jgi:hypothetical protein
MVLFGGGLERTVAQCTCKAGALSDADGRSVRFPPPPPFLNSAILWYQRELRSLGLSLPFFCVDRFQYAILEQRFGQNRLQLFEPPGIGQIHVTVFLTPAMERGFRDIGMG